MILTAASSPPVFLKPEPTTSTQPEQDETQDDAPRLTAEDVPTLPLQPLAIGGAVLPPDMAEASFRLVADGNAKLDHWAGACQELPIDLYAVQLLDVLAEQLKQRDTVAVREQACRRAKPANPGEQQGPVERRAVSRNDATT